MCTKRNTPMTDYERDKVRDMANALSDEEKDIMLKTLGIDINNSINIGDLYYLKIRNRITNEITLSCILYDKSENLDRVKYQFKISGDAKSIGEVHKVALANGAIINKPDVFITLE